MNPANSQGVSQPSFAKVEQSISVRHIAEYVYCLATAVRYCQPEPRRSVWR